jgi:hypothetical protein
MITLISAAVMGVLCSIGILGIVKDFKNNKKK